MLRTKEILTAVGTLGCAIGIGFVMQSSDSAEKRYGPTDTSALAGAVASNSVLDVQDITLTSGELGTEEVVMSDAPPADDATQVIPVSAPQSIAPEAETAELAPVPSCAITATARPVAGAMVNVQMDATCLPNERVTLHHNGMIFTETTSANGSVDLTVPALSTEAVFILAFSNGEGAVAQTTVEELTNFDRAVLQWRGDTGFQIHALEFGANYGSAGHLWQETPGDLAGAVTGAHGVLTLLGDSDAPDPLLAEVYTFPKASSSRTGTVTLSVETEVTNANCGLEIEAQSLEVRGAGQIKTQNLNLPVPECDAIGSFLVLNNLLQDLKVAAR